MLVFSARSIRRDTYHPMDKVNYRVVSERVVDDRDDDLRKKDQTSSAMTQLLRRPSKLYHIRDERKRRNVDSLVTKKMSIIYDYSVHRYS